MFVTGCFSIPRNLPSACMIGVPKPGYLLRYLHAVELVGDGKDTIRKAIARRQQANVRPRGAIVARLRLVGRCADRGETNLVPALDNGLELVGDNWRRRHARTDIG